MSPLEILQNPETVQSMTVAQKIIIGGQIALLGMIIVFIILIILMICLKGMENIFYKTSKGVSREISGDLGEKQTKETVSRNKRKMVAVITAALLNSYYQSASDIEIQQITSVKDDVPIWGRIARGGGKFKNIEAIRGDKFE